MDQIRIGRFIAERRKRVGLTQAQLAEKLNITDRAVSKWETGKAMPDSSIMLELCGILAITVNDLLSGEVVVMENYSKETEKNLLKMVKEKEESDRRLLALEWVIAILSLVVLLIPTVIALCLPLAEWQRLVIVLSGLLPALVGLLIAVRIEQIAGYYECAHCAHKYVPTYASVTFAMHMGRTRYMKCPKCGRRSWQSKVIERD